MDSPAERNPDSPPRRGGTIPGSGGLPAFEISGPSPSAIPVLIAVPHAGRAYPDGLLSRLRDPATVALRLEDRHADLLGRAVARATGAMLAIAHAPRAMIDLNRAPDDVDWDMFGLRAPSRGQEPAGRARSGLGLVPRRITGIGELWKHRHDPSELEQRLSAIHEPWHAALSDALEGLRARWGAALLVDLHSMPPLPPRGGGPAARFVIGDRFGATCHGSLVATAFSCLGEERQPAAHNRPYAGGYGLERHACPRGGIHAVQIEVDRSCYLDSRLDRPGEGLEQTAGILARLVGRLASEVAALGQGRAAQEWPQAAE
jgi:N-formylglutamate amidohydrolase